MSDPRLVTDDIKEKSERAETDRSLAAERTKTDSELRKGRADVAEDADAAIRSARQDADATTRASRRREDASSWSGAPPGSTVLDERVTADAAVASERKQVDAATAAERIQRDLALAALLRLEREDTDVRLKVERLRGDDAVRARDDFFAMVNHDLRTLLGGISLSADMVANLATGQQPIAATARHAESIQRIVERMNRLIGDLVDIASIEAGKLVVEPTPDDGAQLVEDALEMFQPVAAAHGVTLTSAVESHPALAKFDHDRILQVIGNLVGNSLKFTTGGGNVTIHVRDQGSEVLFAVADTGCGIPADQLGAAFERFSQAGRSDRRGLGLGLYISRCIIDAHGGRIWATSEVDRGTTVSFTLPTASQSL